jgi:hypothetical protein
VLLDSNPAEARFLTPEERLWAIERLRDNNTGLETSEWRWGTIQQVGQSSLLVRSSLITEKIKGKQVLETLISPQIWLFVALSFCLNFGASVTNVFGPLIIKGIGFDSRVTILLNIPFGESGSLLRSWQRLLPTDITFHFVSTRIRPNVLHSRPRLCRYQT